MDGWSHSPEGVEQIAQLLAEYQRPGADQSQVFQRLQQCRSFPDFNNYLAFIVGLAEDKPIEVRQSAGLLLKNNLKAEYMHLSPAFRGYIKAALLPQIGHPNKHLRSAVGTVLSVIVVAGGLADWPELLSGMVQCLQHADPNLVEGSVDCLFKICEEVPMQVDAQPTGAPSPAGAMLIPHVLALFTNASEHVRRTAVSVMNELLGNMPNTLRPFLDTLLQGLFSLAHDGSNGVRRVVCTGLVQLLDCEPERLFPHMQQLMEYFLSGTEHGDHGVALESCEFWAAFCEAQLPKEMVQQLKGYLPRLIPVLLTNMRYADDDDDLLAAEDDDDVADRDQDVKPFQTSTKDKGDGGRGEGEGEEGGGEEDDDDDQEAGQWNLRKSSAAGLDVMSTVFGAEILPVMMPVVERRLVDPDWRVRESAILAIGAVAEGCMAGLMPQLPTILSFLLPLLQDPRPLVRSITCWTLSRFSKFVVEAGSTAPPGAGNPLDTLITGLLERAVENNKRVQQAACSAFATLEEEALEALEPRLDFILKHLMFAFSKYGKKNLRILYDALRTLTESVGPVLGEPAHLQQLLPPLIAKWQSLGDGDRELLPLLECLTAVVSVLGSSFIDYTEPVFMRCIRIVQTQMQLLGLEQKGVMSEAGEYDRDFVVCALDLLSGIADGIGPSVESLVGRTRLVGDMLLACCDNPAADVRQSAFALLGDLAKSCPAHLQPHLRECITLCAKNVELLAGRVMRNEETRGDVMSACNNACWAAGELSYKVPQEEIKPYAMLVAQHIFAIMGAADHPSVNRNMTENCAITLGRLGWVCPAELAPHMQYFMVPWCRALRRIRDDLEKEHAFLGLCAMVRANPAGALASFVEMCLAISSWRHIRQEGLGGTLRNEIGAVLQMFKTELTSRNQWAQAFGMVDPAAKEKLTAMYGL